MTKPTVYFIKNINQDNLVKLFDLLNVDLGKRIAIKVHSGEKGNQNFLRPEFYKKIVDHVGGTIVECNTAYKGARNTTEKHRILLDEHG